MQNIKEYVSEKKIKLMQETSNISMAIIQVGHVPASDRYVRNKIKDCEDTGIQCGLISLSESITEEELLLKIDELNKSDLTGYLVQLPLPKHINEERIKLAVAPDKDIDGFHPLSKTVPATPLGIFEFLKDNNFCFEGHNAVIVGRSSIVGKPMAKLLLDSNMNTTILHSKTSESDKKHYLENADLIVVATGHEHTITNKYNFKSTAVIMDVGINIDANGKLCGDCDKGLPVQFQSPVPGGCGLLTRLAVIYNLIELNKNKKD